MASMRGAVVCIKLAAFISVSIVACTHPRVMAQQPPKLRTVAESSQGSRTATHAEVVLFLDQLSAQSTLVHRASLGTSVEGREIPMVVVASEKVQSPAEARALSQRLSRPIVLIIGNIHAGEIDGKEALPAIARDVASGAIKGILEQVILIIVPIFNADGNERFGLNNRPGQNGPASVGIRENANGRDLNRDFMKLEEPETVALVRAMNEWDPHVFIDCHITNGSFHRYVVTYAGLRAPAGDPQLMALSQDKMLPEIDAIFEKATGQHAFFYGSFEGEFAEGDRGHTRWESFPAEPRFGTTYVGLRNRLSILVETYTYAPYLERVQATRDFVLASLTWTGDNSGLVLAETRAADQRTINRFGDADRAKQSVAIASKPGRREEPVEILGFHEVTEDGRSRSTGQPCEYLVELWDAAVPTVSVVPAAGYLIPAGSEFDRVTALLKRHGIHIEELKEAVTGRCEEYRVVTLKPASRMFQGHALIDCKVEATEAVMSFPAGTWLVRTAQPLGALVTMLLEPHGEDSAARWNAFDQWMKPGEKYPVIRVMDAAMVAGKGPADVRP